MAILSDGDRSLIWGTFMSERSSVLDEFGALTKQDIRAAVNALDDFLSNNAANINSAIPQPARAQLSVVQKALLLQFVVARRYLSGA